MIKIYWGFFILKNVLLKADVEENDIDKLRENIKKARQYRHKKKDKKKVDQLKKYFLKNLEFIRDKNRSKIERVWVCLKK